MSWPILPDAVLHSVVNPAKTYSLNEKTLPTAEQRKNQQLQAATSHILATALGPVLSNIRGTDTSVVTLPTFSGKTATVGVRPVIENNGSFSRAFNDFCFTSMLTKPQAVVALGIVNTECRQVSEHHLLRSNLVKSSRLEEFESLQQSAMSQTTHFLKDTWSAAIKASIKQTLKEVGKGWFNLEEKSREVYQFSKLKRFLTMSTFRMQDALRELLQCNLQVLSVSVANM